MSQKPYTFGKKTMHFHTLATILQVRKKIILYNLINNTYKKKHLWILTKILHSKNYIQNLRMNSL